MAGKERELPPRKYNSRSNKAGLTFPVGRIAQLLNDGKYADRIGYAAPVYMAAILEYLARELIELAGNAAVDNNRRRISPRHIEHAVRGDTELSKLLGHVTFSCSGGKSIAQLQPLRKKAAASGTKKEASPGKKAAGSSGTTTEASPGKKAAGSSGTTKAASSVTEKLGSWGAKKPATSRTKKDDKK